MKYSIINLFLITLVVAACDTKANRSQAGIEAESYSKYKPTYFKNPDGSIGFDVLKNGKVFIHQPLVPAISGNSGFSTESDAQKVAKLMIYKLNHGIIPPTISRLEVDSLQIAYH